MPILRKYLKDTQVSPEYSRPVHYRPVLLKLSTIIAIVRNDNHIPMATRINLSQLHLPKYHIQNAENNFLIIE